MHQIFPNPSLRCVRTLVVMKKRQESTKPLIISSIATPSTTPATIQSVNADKTTTKSISITSTFKKTKRKTFTSNISSHLKSSPKYQSLHWLPLNLPKSELFLPLTFPTGQTFRWKQTGHHQYTGVIKSHLISLKQLETDGVAFCVHSTADDESSARNCLSDYLNLGISLCEMWKEFSVSDSNFAELALHLGGARVLRQDPLECLIQFLCSSNNNIGRITKMVDFISSLGEYLGTVEGFEFHEFPSLERLSLVSENELRAAGFGYRASVQLPFSSFGKPPRSSLPPQPKFEKHFQITPEDETPEILRGNSSPISGVKSASPNRNRVSPPHNGHPLSPGRKSSRKLVLQSIPAFPSLTQHKDDDS